MIMTTNSDRGNLRIQRWLALLVVAIMAIGYIPGANTMVRHTSSSVDRRTSSSVDRRTSSSVRQSIKSPEQNKLTKTQRQSNQTNLAKAKLEERKKDETALLIAYERIFLIAGMNELMYIVKDIAKAERNDAPSHIQEAKARRLVRQYVAQFKVPQKIEEFLPKTLTWIVDKVKGDEIIYDMMNSIAAKQHADKESKYGTKTAALLFNVFMADTYETTYNAMKDFALNALVEFVVSAERKMNISGHITMFDVVDTLKHFCTPLNDADVPNHHRLTDETLQATYERLQSISDKIVTDLKDNQRTSDKNLQQEDVQQEDATYARLTVNDIHQRILLSGKYKRELYKRVQDRIPLKYRVTIEV